MKLRKQSHFSLILPFIWLSHLATGYFYTELFQGNWWGKDSNSSPPTPQPELRQKDTAKKTAEDGGKVSTASLSLSPWGHGAEYALWEAWQSRNQGRNSTQEVMVLWSTGLLGTCLVWVTTGSWGDRQRCLGASSGCWWNSSWGFWAAWWRFFLGGINGWEKSS